MNNGARVIFELGGADNGEGRDRDYFAFSTGPVGPVDVVIHLDDLGLNGCDAIGPFDAPTLAKPGEASLKLYPYVDDGEGGLVADLAQEIIVDLPAPDEAQDRWSRG